MRSVGTDGVPCCVGRSVTVVSPRKMAEPIEVLFGLRHRVGPRKHVLDGGPDSRMRRVNFKGESMATLL